MSPLRVSPPAAVALAAALMFAAATGGAVAGTAVTSAQIKNGTITAKDVKKASLTSVLFAPDATAALTGPRGPAGTNGAAGSNGVSGYQVVTNASPYITTADEIALNLACPAGKVPLGGTALIEGVSPTVSYVTMYPQSATVWHFTGAAPAGAARRLEAWLTCASTG